MPDKSDDSLPYRSTPKIDHEHNIEKSLISWSKLNTHKQREREREVKQHIIQSYIDYGNILGNSDLYRLDYCCEIRIESNK